VPVPSTRRSRVAKAEVAVASSAVRPVLTESEIVAAALEIVEESGVDSLTMRRLSAKLGVALGATYHHVPNKHALLVLIADELYGRIKIPERVDGDWRSQIREVLLNVTEVMGAYPGVAAYIMRHPTEIPLVDVMEATGDALDCAGLRDEAAARVLSALFFYLAGTIVSGAITTLRPETMTSEEAAARFADGLDVVLTGIEVEVERQQRSDGAHQRR
jgi:TetR/AcrR family tetracycline transcriptional repressor